MSWIEYFSTILVPWSANNNNRTALLEQINWLQHLFLWIVNFAFVFKEIQFYKQSKYSKFFHCQIDLLLKTGVTNVTLGYMNVFDWLVIQLTSKQHLLWLASDYKELMRLVFLSFSLASFLLHEFHPFGVGWKWQSLALLIGSVIALLLFFENNSIYKYISI